MPLTRLFFKRISGSTSLTAKIASYNLINQSPLPKMQLTYQCIRLSSSNANNTKILKNDKSSLFSRICKRGIFTIAQRETMLLEASECIKILNEIDGLYMKESEYSLRHAAQEAVNLSGWINDTVTRHGAAGIQNLTNSRPFMDDGVQVIAWWKCGINDLFNGINYKTSFCDKEKNSLKIIHEMIIEIQTVLGIGIDDQLENQIRKMAGIDKHKIKLPEKVIKRGLFFDAAREQYYRLQEKDDNDEQAAKIKFK